MCVSYTCDGAAPGTPALPATLGGVQRAGAAPDTPSLGSGPGRRQEHQVPDARQPTLGYLGHLGALLGQSWANLGAILGLSWQILGLSWGYLGAILACHVGPTLGQSGSVGEPTLEVSGSVGGLSGSVGELRGSVGELRGSVGECRGASGKCRGVSGSLGAASGKCRGCRGNFPLPLLLPLPLPLLRAHPTEPIPMGRKQFLLWGVPSEAPMLGNAGRWQFNNVSTAVFPTFPIAPRKLVSEVLFRLFMEECWARILVNRQRSCWGILVEAFLYSEALH